MKEDGKVELRARLEADRWPDKRGVFRRQSEYAV